MSKHTPGPWRIGRASSAIVSDTKPQQARDDESFELDRQHYGGYLIAESVFSEADAKLIAAAPDLLEALQALFTDYKQGADSGDWGYWRLEDTDAGKQAIAALNKAYGNT